MHTIPSKQSQGHSPKRSVAGSTNNDTSGVGTGTGAAGSRTNSTHASKSKKSAINSLNPEKLKQYLITSQNDDISQTIHSKPASRNVAGESTLTGSHRNLHTVGHLVMKSGNSGFNNTRTTTGDMDSRKNQNMTLQGQVAAPPYSKTITQKPNDNRNSTSIKNGSKRRANSNHTADKKVNLDKFLSVVQ